MLVYNRALTSGEQASVTSYLTAKYFPVTLSIAKVGNNVTLNWPADHTGWQLQVQTNSLNVGLSTNWTVVAGSTATNQWVVPINSANASVFYRLALP
jgi:hypothetical protein